MKIRRLTMLGLVAATVAIVAATAGCTTTSSPAATPPIGAPGGQGPGMMGGTPAPGGMMQGTPGAGGPGGMMSNGGMMGGGMMGSGMMMGGIMGGPFSADAQPISMDQATSITRDYQGSLNTPELIPDEIMEFSQNFYVPFKERGSGVFAFEILIDRYTGAVYPEPGPNMMWNRKYSMMGRGMGTPYSETSAQMPISADQATTKAIQFLKGFWPGATAGDIDTFYGYHTIDIKVDGKVQGMLGVNGFTGDVWYHTWHGPFIQVRENP